MSVPTHVLICAPGERDYVQGLFHHNGAGTAVGLPIPEVLVASRAPDIEGRIGIASWSMTTGAQAAVLEHLHSAHEVAECLYVIRRTLLREGRLP